MANTEAFKVAGVEALSVDVEIMNMTPKGIALNIVPDGNKLVVQVWNQRALDMAGEVEIGTIQRIEAEKSYTIKLTS